MTLFIKFGITWTIISSNAVWPRSHTPVTHMRGVWWCLTGSSSSFQFSSNLSLSLLQSGRFLLPCCKFILRFLFSLQPTVGSCLVKFFIVFFTSIWSPFLFWDFSSACSVCLSFPLNPWTRSCYKCHCLWYLWLVFPCYSLVLFSYILNTVVLHVTDF